MCGTLQSKDWIKPKKAKLVTCHVSQLVRTSKAESVILGCRGWLSVGSSPLLGTGERIYLSHSPDNLNCGHGWCRTIKHTEHFIHWMPIWKKTTRTWKNDISDGKMVNLLFSLFCYHSMEQSCQTTFWQYVHTLAVELSTQCPMAFNLKTTL